MTNSQGVRRVVLLGIGHTNAHVVREWGRRSIPDCELVCISNSPQATYSGMLPAVLAGQIPPQKMQIDLAKLCDRAGANLRIGDVTGLAADSNELIFKDGPSQKFDILSVGIGSIPNTDEMSIVEEACLPIKPMQTFLDRLQKRIERLRFQKGSSPIQVTIIGGGVAGCEVACCLDQRFKTMSSGAFSLRVIHAGQELLGNETDGLKSKVENELSRRKIEIVLGKRVREVGMGQIHLANGTRLENDVCVVVTGAAPAPLIQKLELPVGVHGFLATDQNLQSISGRPIFAVGDCGSIVDHDVPKAGVYAVRQGPILWENIQRLLAGNRLRPFRPQSSFLKLMNLGDGTAAGEWHGLSFRGKWAMALKSAIDGAFVAKYQ